MAVNTEALDDGKYITCSSISVVASRATLKTVDLVASGTQTVTSTLSVGGAATFQGTTQHNGSNNTFAALGITGLFTSSATTAQSASTAKIVNGQLIFSILSLTTNGAALYYRSGNSTYVWPSSGAIG